MRHWSSDGRWGAGLAGRQRETSSRPQRRAAADSGHDQTTARGNREVGKVSAKRDCTRGWHCRISDRCHRHQCDPAQTTFTAAAPARSQQQCVTRHSLTLLGMCVNGMGRISSKQRAHCTPLGDSAQPSCPRPLGQIRGSDPPAAAQRHRSPAIHLPLRSPWRSRPLQPECSPLPRHSC